MDGETRFDQKLNAGIWSSVALAMLVQVQPVNAGTTWSNDDTAVVVVNEDTVVVVVDGGTGPVNESANV